MYIVDRWRYIELLCHALVKECTSQIDALADSIAGGGKTGLICVHSDTVEDESGIVCNRLYSVSAHTTKRGQTVSEEIASITQSRQRQDKNYR